MAFTGSVVDLQPTLKKKTAVSRSWILLDCNGNGTMLDVDKYAIMRLVEINARDLRILDPLLSYPSTILGREKVIVLNLEVNALFFLYHELLLSLVLFASGLVQSLIGLSRLVSSSSYSISKLLSPQRRCYSETRWMMMLFLLSSNFKEGCPKCLAHGQAKEKEKRRVPKKLKATKKMVRPAETSIRKEFPFEFRALEVALEAICSFLDARTRELETAAYPALDELTSKISSRNLDRVRKLKSAMTTLTNRVQKIRDELENLLDDDDDMADLYLSRKMAGSCSPTSSCDAPNWILSSPTIGSRVRRSSRASATTFQGENDVEELEMLLEAYFMQIDGTLNKLTTLREYIDDTEDYINIQLDNHRNQLIQLELFLSSGTVCLSIYSLVGAIFGMNIPYTWRQGHGYMFKWVVIFTGIFCGSLFLSIVSYARRKGLVGS